MSEEFENGIREITEGAEEESFENDGEAWNGETATVIAAGRKFEVTVPVSVEQIKQVVARVGIRKSYRVRLNNTSLTPKDFPLNIPGQTITIEEFNEAKTF